MVQLAELFEGRGGFSEKDTLLFLSRPSPYSHEEHSLVLTTLMFTQEGVHPKDPIEVKICQISCSV